MGIKEPTIYDVATKAGISIATVSRVLNNPEKVSSKTKNRVFKIMDELNFTPKADARHRAKKNTGRIGIITFDLDYPAFAPRLKGISKALEGTPFELIIITVKKLNDFEYYLRSINLTDSIDGLIVLSHKLTSSTLKLLDELSIKTVFIEFGEDTFTSVGTDNFQGGTIVADFLLSKNYINFAVLTESESDKYVHPNQLRVSGFMAQLSKHGIDLNRDGIFYTNDNINDSIKSAEEILLKKDRPEVIFATTDLLAVSVMKAAKKLNISIPEELGVIGFDGTNISEYMDITTIDQHLEESGKIAAKLLIQSIIKPESTIQKILLPLNIIERDTIRD